MDIRIDIDDRELQAAWAQVPEIVQEELEAATWESELLLEREIKELTPIGVSGGAGGGARASISAREPTVLADQVIGVVGGTAAHLAYLELGTKPHFPPLQPLRDWAVRKLNVSEKESYGVALAIARKIAARGTLAVGMFHRAFNANRLQVEQAYSAAHVRIVERMGGA